ncbi:cytidylate kinase [Chitinophaga arvensicola]|uniref:Cytidylate kinase n=1 Tax=Chitinophaga arvensicola TaxID=29529 RepID=A0A1I0QZP8_9BACT|nr:cytidylate kinase [Chitinophaga arvensicola]
MEFPPIGNSNPFVLIFSEICPNFVAFFPIDDSFKQLVLKKIIITIDGYSSCGKSTLAKQLAKKLNYTYIDSGAMYRAITLYFIQNRIDWQSHEAVAAALRDVHLDFVPNSLTGLSEMYLNNENVEHLIREMVVAEKVSEVAAVKEVRDLAVAQQKKMGARKGIVMDGRDIGTVVFPHAELKIFMTAEIAIRVQRRFKEIYEKNRNITLEEVKQNLELRDYIDANREISPLRKADDAIILDNSHLNLEDQLQLVMQWVEDAIMAHSS